MIDVYLRRRGGKRKAYLTSVEANEATLQNLKELVRVYGVQIGALEDDFYAVSYGQFAMHRSEAYFEIVVVDA